jgi:hypothetical protein
VDARDKRGHDESEIPTVGEELKKMTERDKIRGIIESAVESAFIDFPSIGPGETWPQHYRENAECRTLATAVLSSLEKWGYKIVPTSGPDEHSNLGLDRVDTAQGAPREVS